MIMPRTGDLSQHEHRGPADVWAMKHRPRTAIVWGSRHALALHLSGLLVQVSHGTAEVGLAILKRPFKKLSSRVIGL
jgi:hypothetical protein